MLASPLSRAVETARLAGFEHGVQLDERLKEWDYGDYEGMTTSQIRETRPDWFLWRDGCPGGESPEQIGARADSLVRDVRDIDGDVLLFAHGHILRVLAARAGSASLPRRARCSAWRPRRSACSAGSARPR